MNLTDGSFSFVQQSSVTTSLVHPSSHDAYNEKVPTSDAGDPVLPAHRRASTVHRAFASAGGATTHLLAPAASFRAARHYPAASFRAAQQPAANSFVAAGDAALAANALE